jgi:hypothetical protein
MFNDDLNVAQRLDSFLHDIFTRKCQRGQGSDRVSENLINSPRGSGRTEASTDIFRCLFNIKCIFTFLYVYKIIDN